MGDEEPDWPENPFQPKRARTYIATCVSFSGRSVDFFLRSVSFARWIESSWVYVLSIAIANNSHDRNVCNRLELARVGRSRLVGRSVRGCGPVGVGRCVGQSVSWSVGSSVVPSVDRSVGVGRWVGGSVGRSGS